MKKLIFIYILLILGTIIRLSAQMVDPPNWKNYEKTLNLKNGLRHYDFDVELIYTSVPSNVFWLGDKVSFTFQIVSNIDKPIETEGKVDVIRYGAKGIPGDIWLPEMYRIGEVQSIPVKIKIAPNGYTNIDLSPDIPDLFGGYALVLDLGEYGRRLMTGLVRSMKPSPVAMQYPKQSLDDLGVEFLSRVGVQAIRFGVSYSPTTMRDYQSEMRKLNAELKKYKENNITVLLMFGEGASLTPLGTPRSFLDENGVYLRTKQDYAWLPSLDDDFRKFVREICLKHGWPKGPVTAVSLWNEPWEGISISGWQADMLRYREIYKAMANGVLDARKEGADVLVGGCDSNSNAWDKLFSDGTMDMLPIFDFVSIHYQGMESPALYPEWNNRKDHKGRVLIWDTESWVGNTDDRIGLVVATNRSAGYDRSMGIYGGYMYTRGHFNENDQQTIRTANGVERIPALHYAWSPAAALGAVQSLIGERDFRELLFTNGLPWVMVFDGYNNNRDDGTVVVAGDLSEAFGADNLLFRSVGRLTEEGKMTVNADPSFRVYDFYGNTISSVRKVYEIPLNYRGYFLRTDGSRGSFDKLIKALKQSRIEGYEPVEIIARDFTCPIALHPEMELQITNILNRNVSGKLTATAGQLKLSCPAQLQLKPHETQIVKLKVTEGDANPENNYPLEVRFDAGADGIAAHKEDMHVNYIAKRTVTVDGKLDDWDGVIPQTVKGSSKASVSLTEAAWYPFKNFDAEAEGYANAYLAYDNNYFYFAAKVADKTPNRGTYRFETRPDDEFFYPPTAYMQTIQAMDAVEVSKETGADNENALQMPDGTGRMMNYWENTETTQSIGFDLDLPEDQFVQTNLFFPAREQNDLEITVTDRATGKELLSQNIPNVWNGVYLSLDLSGKVRIRCSASGWWYTVKVAGIFFDKSGENPSKTTAARLIAKDFDTRGNWKGVYGKYGYCLSHIHPVLPDGVKCSPVKYDDLITLKWPEGVRRYSYRKDPVLPDASMAEPADNIQIAFNVLPIGQDGMEACPKGTMPRYIGYKCTDYEYALNTVAPEYGGGFEIWRMLVPGMPRKHFYPRQPKSPYDGAVKDGKLVTRREGNTLYTECAIPWTEIPDVKKALDKGEKIKFSFRVNDDGARGGLMELAYQRSVSKMNSRAFHPDWKEHWANEVEFGFEK